MKYTVKLVYNDVTDYFFFGHYRLVVVYIHRDVQLGIERLSPRQFHSTSLHTSSLVPRLKGVWAPTERGLGID